MKEIVEKLYSKYPILFVFAFSLFATIIALPSIQYNNEPIYIIKFNSPIYRATNEPIMKSNAYQLSLFVLNILCFFYFIVSYLISMEKNKKRNAFIFIILFIGFIIKILCTFDLFFFKSNISVIFFIIPFLLVSLVLLPLSSILTNVSKNIPNIPSVQEYVNMPSISEYIGIGAILFFIILINNIIIKIIFKYLVFKNNNKNMILTLYFTQNNTQLINLLAFINVIEFFGSQ